MYISCAVVVNSWLSLQILHFSLTTISSSPTNKKQQEVVLSVITFSTHAHAEVAEHQWVRSHESKQKGQRNCSCYFQMYTKVREGYVYFITKKQVIFSEGCYTVHKINGYEVDGVWSLFYFLFIFMQEEKLY